MAGPRDHVYSCVHEESINTYLDLCRAKYSVHKISIIKFTSKPGGLRVKRQRVSVSLLVGQVPNSKSKTSRGSTIGYKLYGFRPKNTEIL